MLEQKITELKQLINSTNPNQPLILVKAKQLVKYQEAHDLGYDIDPLTEQAQQLIERLKNESCSN